MGVTIEGLVTKTLELEAADLASMPGQIDDVAAFVAGRHGAAVRLAAVLERAGIETGAEWLTVESDDGSFAASVPLEAVREALLVHSLDGAPLPRDKGGPVRLLIPDAARCGTAEVDKCANVKNVGVLRLDAGHGHDTRPSTKEQHVEMHRRQSK
jgi:DMSO/TMAO reductase YedYZ molybdopterin-dependent catalytic subunit